MQSTEPIVKDFNITESEYQFKGFIKITSHGITIRKVRFESKQQSIYQMEYLIREYAIENSKYKYLTVIFDEPIS